MKVLVDTSVWSIALRRRPHDLSDAESRLRSELADLIDADRIVMVGPVRQELLSGISDGEVFDRLREHLAGFDDEPLTTADFEAAAQVHNACRATGVSGSAIDFLICAAAQRRGLPVFTTDRDFERYSAVVPFELHRPR